MDLAGLAALLSVPVAVLTALLPLRDRATLSRLERVDRLLRDTDLDAHHKMLLIQVRRVLVRRVSAAELSPGLTPLGIAMLCISVVFALGLIALGVRQSVVDDGGSFASFTGAAIVLAGVGAIALLQPIFRRRFQDALRPQPSPSRDEGL